MSISVLTRAYGNDRSGANTQESVLTAAAVRSRGIKRLFSMPLPGDRRGAEAQTIVEQLKQDVLSSGIGRYEIALIYAGLGDKNNAFTWLERSFVSRYKGMQYLKVDPCLDPLREDPRLQDLIKRVGFPAA